MKKDLFSIISKKIIIYKLLTFQNRKFLWFKQVVLPRGVLRNHIRGRGGGYKSGIYIFFFLGGGDIVATFPTRQDLQCLMYEEGF